MWVSTTKYFSPSLSYTLSPRSRREVEAEPPGRVLGVGEHDRPVVLVDHRAVPGGPGLLELRRVYAAGVLAERLGDLVVADVHAVHHVHPDHDDSGGREPSA